MRYRVRYRVRGAQASGIRHRVRYMPLGTGARSGIWLWMTLEAWHMAVDDARGVADDAGR